MPSQTLLRVVFALGLILAPIALTGCDSSSAPVPPGGTPTPEPKNLTDNYPTKGAKK